MRQAGRYLPEYRAVRAKAGGFLDLCYTPELAAEVTLQPIRRFGFDAAILFADILMVPDALGQGVRFVEGEGPRLDAIRSEADLARLSASATRPKFARVFETVARVRQDLPRETALIGFCGAPWTVATYMVGGQGSADQADARLWAYRDAAGFQRLIDLLVDVSVDYLSGQIEAGADVVQIFDSWAGSLPDDQFRRWVIEPTQAHGGPAEGAPSGRADHRLSARRGRAGQVLRGRDGRRRGELRYGDAAGLRGARAVGRTVVQGNLDPLLLVTGGTALERRVAEILAALSQQAVHLQPGPRHRARDAARECGAAGGVWCVVALRSRDTASSSRRLVARDPA